MLILLPKIALWCFPVNQGSPKYSRKQELVSQNVLALVQARVKKNNIYDSLHQEAF